MHFELVAKSIPRRRAYTLMEVVVAMAISVVLLAAVYTTFFLFMQQAQSGRDVASQANVARAVFTQITQDVSGQLAPLDPRVLQFPEGMFEAEEDAEASATTNEDTNSNTGSGEQPKTDTGAGGNAETELEEELPAEPAVIFNMGVVGLPEQLMLFVSRPPGLARPGEGMKPDLRRISYWIVQGPDGPLGLARQEVDVATSEQALVEVPFEAKDQEQFLFARQVVSIQFEYFDGVAWLTEWEGGETFDIGGKKMPQGPPLAIAMTVLLVDPGGVNINGEVPTRQFRHVIAVPCANSPVDPEVAAAAAGATEP